MNRSTKRDANHREIVEALRKAGCSVRDLSAVGQGFPDIAVGRKGVTYLLELKDGSKPPSARRLTPDEAIFHATWDGHAVVVLNAQEALAAVGLRPVVDLEPVSRRVPVG